nr:hypothetical protein CFP56_76691 [Quercus suber]
MRRSSARKLDEKQSQNLGQKSSKILSEQSARKHEKAAAAKKTNLKRRSGDVDDYVKDANQDGEDQNSEEQRSEVEEQDIEEAYTTGAGGDNHYDGSITRSMPSGAPDLSLGTATGTLHAQAISSKQISTARVLAPSSKYSSVVSTSRRGHPEALVHAAIKNLKIMESTWHQTKLALEVITRILSREAVITLRDFLISVRSDMQIVQNMRSGEALSAPEDMPSVVEFQKFYTAVAEYQYIREDSSCIDLQQMRMLDRIAGTYIDLVQLIRTDESVFEKLRVSFEKYRKTVRGNTKGALSKHSPENTALTVLTSMQRPEGNRTNLAKDKKSLRNRIHQGANLRVLRKTFGDGAWAMLLEWAWRSRLQIVHHDTLAAAAHAIVTVEPNIKTIFQRLTYAIVLPLLRHQIPTHQLAFEQTTIHLLENDPGLMLTDLLGDGIEDYDMDQAADDEDDMDMMDESPYLMLGGTSTKQDAAMESHESIADEKDAGLDGPESIADTPYQRDPEDDD